MMYLLATALILVGTVGLWAASAADRQGIQIQNRIIDNMQKTIDAKSRTIDILRSRIDSKVTP
jgi:hypothetical protein